MKIESVERLCTKCIEEEGIIQPMFFYKDKKLVSHIHNKINKEKEKEK